MVNASSPSSECRTGTGSVTVSPARGVISATTAGETFGASETRR